MQGIGHEKRQRPRIFTVKVGLKQDFESLKEQREGLRSEWFSLQGISQAFDHSCESQFSLFGCTRETYLSCEIASRYNDDVCYPLQDR